MLWILNYNFNVYKHNLQNISVSFKISWNTPIFDQITGEFPKKFSRLATLVSALILYFSLRFDGPRLRKMKLPAPPTNNRWGLFATEICRIKFRWRILTFIIALPRQIMNFMISKINIKQTCFLNLKISREILKHRVIKSVVVPLK